MSQPSQPEVVHFVGNSFAYASPGHLIAVGAVLPAIGIIIVIIRFYTRKLKKLKYGIDDYLILPALLFVIGMGAAIIAGVKEGAIGYPTPQPPMDEVANNPAFILSWKPRQTVIVQKVQFITQLFMVAAYGLIKLSVIYFYRRIFNIDKSGKFNLVTNAFSIFIVAWTVAYIFAVAFDCRTNWFAHWGSIADILQYCNGGAVIKIVQSLLYTDLITDVLILLLPMPRIWTLHLTPAKKIALTGIFLLGGVATGAAAARIYIFNATIKRSEALDPTLDNNLSVSTVLYWSMIEAGLSLIAACLPTTQHIFRGRSIGSVVASVRSAISLPSITRSQNSGNSQNSRNKNTGLNERNASRSFQRLAESRSLEEQNGGLGKESTTLVSDDEIHSGPGVKKTVWIEMTSHEGTEEPRVVDAAWDKK